MTLNTETIPSPTTPGLYRVNRMEFMLNRQGQWHTWDTWSGHLRWAECEWGYIEQMLGVHDLVLEVEWPLLPPPTDPDELEEWLQS